MREAHVTAMAAITPAAELTWGRSGPWPAGSPHPGIGPRSPDWFDAARLMGGVRHRYLNDCARFSVAASQACVGEVASAAWADSLEERRGVILGTAVADFTIRQVFDTEVMVGGFAALNAVSTPNMSANIAAAQVAIACRARAFSTTLTSPFLSGFEALYLAAQSLQLGRADAVLAIAAEEDLPDQDPLTVLPGAVALHLQAGRPSHGGDQAIAASCWGHVGKDTPHPSSATRAFLQRVAQRQASALVPLAFELLHSDTPTSNATAERWQGWLNQSALGLEQRQTHVFATAGTVDPMLFAARALSHARPVLLLAIHERRYLAFLFIPHVPSTHQGAFS